MKVIDTHTHLGTSGISGWTVTEGDLLTAMDANGVDQALVMPHAVTANPAAEHDRVAELCDREPRFRGIVSLTPHQDEQSYRAEVSRCRDMGFVAVKLNPMQHATSPLMPSAEKIFRTASELGLPVIVHTGLGGAWAMPSLLIPVAQRFPDLVIVLAHAGYAHYTEDARIAAEQCSNIYLEPSWCQVTAVAAMITAVGSGRVMLGSDHPLNLPVELAKYRALGLPDQELADVLGGTAAHVFQL